MIIIFAVLASKYFAFFGHAFLANFAFFDGFSRTDAQGTDEFTLDELHWFVVAASVIVILTNLASFDAP